MSKSTHRGSNGSRRPGPTGPRTPDGKRRSARNASTHKIFAGRILPDEEKEASRLFAQFQEDLRPQSSLEIEFIGDIVQNRLQARRIDKYLVHEVDKAQVPVLLEDLGQLDARYRSELFRPAAPLAASGDAGRRPLHPMYCVWSLSVLKENIEKHGTRPDGDLVVLDRIYGGELTAAATEIVRLLKLVKLAQAECTGVEGADECASLQAGILEQLDREIKSQEHRWSLECARDQFQIGSNRAQFLPEPVLRRIEQYRSANVRRLMYLLGAIERIRELRKPAAHTTSD